MGGGPLRTSGRRVETFTTYQNEKVDMIASFEGLFELSIDSKLLEGVAVFIYVAVLLENLLGMSCPGTCWPLCGAWFQCRYGGI